ncbi:MAG: hypothetical protein AB7E79_10320 [Rhodospirillaceae bacterium]
MQFGSDSGSLGRAPWWAAPALAILFAAAPASAETRSFVVSFFAQATTSVDGDCSKGVNPTIEEQYLLNLRHLGYSEAEIAAMKKKEDEGNGEIGTLMMTRGRINGQPVNAYAHPTAVVDPKLNALDGKFAYGFDMDGKGRDDPNGFIDPETGQRGVDHEAYRALGCMRTFRGSLKGRPTFWDWAWGQLRDSQPAWLITISGEDLSQDGEVTVTFDRAVEFVASNTDSSPRRDVAYRIDPDPRSHNVYKARIKEGVVLLEAPGTQDFRMLQNPLVTPELKLKRLHMRLNLNGDGSLNGMLGGYQSWRELYFGIGSSGTREACITGDIPGIFYLLRRHADGDPDPATGENTTISTAYYIEAVPAFAVPAESRPRTGG